MKLGRWQYDPKRGLRLDTRKPQLPDTELKEQGYSAVDTGFEDPASGGMPVALITQQNYPKMHFHSFCNGEETIESSQDLRHLIRRQRDKGQGQGGS